MSDETSENRGFETQNSCDSLNSYYASEEMSNEQQKGPDVKFQEKKVKVPPIVVYSYIKDHQKTLDEMADDLKFSTFCATFYFCSTFNL